MGDASVLDALSRLLPSLGLIIAVLLLARWWLQRGSGPTSRTVRITGRTGLTKGALVAVIEADGRRFLIGGGEHGVSLLTELEPAEETVAAAEAVAEDAAGATAPVMVPVLADSGRSGRPVATPALPQGGILDRLRAMTVRTTPERSGRVQRG